MDINVKYEKDDYTLNVFIVEIIKKQGYQLCNCHGVSKNDDIQYFKKAGRDIGILYDDPKNKNYGGSFINRLCRLSLSNFIGKIKVISEDELQITVFGERYKEIILCLREEILFKHFFKKIDILIKEENRWEEFD